MGHVGVKGERGSRVPYEVHSFMGLISRRSLQVSKVIGRQGQSSRTSGVEGPGFQGSRVTGSHSFKGLNIHVGVADRSCSMISKVTGFQGSRVKRSHRLQGIEVSPC